MQSRFFVQEYKQVNERIFLLDLNDFLQLNMEYMFCRYSFDNPCDIFCILFDF